MAWRKRRQLRVTSASLTGRQDCTGTPRSGRGHATPGRSGLGAGTQRCAATAPPPSPSCPEVWSFQGPLLCPFLLSSDLLATTIPQKQPPNPVVRRTQRFFIKKKSTNMPFARALNFCGRANCPSKACFCKNKKKEEKRKKRKKERKHTQ